VRFGVVGPRWPPRRPGSAVSDNEYRRCFAMRPSSGTGAATLVRLVVPWRQNGESLRSSCSACSGQEPPQGDSARDSEAHQNHGGHHDDDHESRPHRLVCGRLDWYWIPGFAFRAEGLCRFRSPHQPKDVARMIEFLRAQLGLLFTVAAHGLQLDRQCCSEHAGCATTIVRVRSQTFATYVVGAFSADRLRTGLARPQINIWRRQRPANALCPRWSGEVACQSIV
jgi:hypothetical protein